MRTRISVFHVYTEPSLLQQHPGQLPGDKDRRYVGGHAGEVAAGTSSCQLPSASRGLFSSRLQPRISFRGEKAKTNAKITVICGLEGACLS